MANSVVAIFLNTARGGPMTPVEQTRAHAGRGLEGNRVFRPEGKAGESFEADREITLIEIEAVEALIASGVPFAAAESRRNVVTRGVPLNDFVGREFTVGPVRLRGLRPCDPCKRLEKLTRPGVLKGLVGRGGLRAEILGDGPIRVGDPVVACPCPPSPTPA